MHRTEVIDSDLFMSVGRATPLVVESIGRLFESVGDRRSIDLLRWQYLGSCGPAYVAIAHTAAGFREGAVAAYSAFPVPARIGSMTGSALQSFDTLTLPSHRGRGLFVQLAKRVYAEASADGQLAVFGFPNERSVKGFVGSLGWSVGGLVPMWIHPVGLRYLRVKAGVRTPRTYPPNPIHSWGSGAEELVESLSHLYGAGEGPGYSGVLHTLNYLGWRLSRPGADYTIHVESDAHGDLTAAGVTTLAVKHGCAVGYIMDLVARPNHSEDAQSVLRSMIGELRRRGADLIFSWQDLNEAAHRRPRYMFMKPPKQILPIRLSFGGKRLHQTQQDRPLPRKFAISYLDSDTV